MVKVIVIDPKDEIILHNVPIENKAAARRVDDFWRAEEEDRGRYLERILLCEGSVRIMDRGMQIPVPVYPVLIRKAALKV